MLRDASLRCFAVRTQSLRLVQGAIASIDLRLPSTRMLESTIPTLAIVMHRLLHDIYQAIEKEKKQEGKCFSYLKQCKRKMTEEQFGKAEKQDGHSRVEIKLCVILGAFRP